jgi:AcrR family transcriptional regulator
MIAACAERGYAAVTVADVVRRAKVSRAAFYLHFGGKLDCFLAATEQGGRLLLERVVSAGRELAVDAPPEDTLRAACRAFLDFLAIEHAFARVFYVDMPAAGPAAADRFEAAERRYAAVNRVWHERARERRPSWPAVPDVAYLALAGASTQLVRAVVRRDTARALRELEDPMVALHLAVLGAVPWQAAGGADSATRES